MHMSSVDKGTQTETDARRCIGWLICTCSETTKVSESVCEELRQGYLCIHVDVVIVPLRTFGHSALVVIQSNTI